MRSTRSIVGAAVVVLALVASACGGGAAPAASPKGPITVGGFNFTEGTILSDIYGKALKAEGYPVTFRLNLGNREIVAPALEKGDIDFYPGYADLEFYNNKAGEASGDTKATVEKLRLRLEPRGLKALDASPAIDTNVFVVKKETATRFNLKKVSDVVPVANQLVFGATPECDKRPFCLPGLQRVYGLSQFKDVKKLDSGGPLTRTALDSGAVDIALLFSTDGVIAVKGWVILDDDKHLQAADNVVPIIRAKVLTDDIARIANRVSGKLTTEALQELNKRASVDKDDPDALADKWLKDNGFAK